MTTTSPEADEVTTPIEPAPPSAFAGGKRRLRNLLLDRIQLRYTAVIVVTSAALTSALGWLFMWQVHEATNTVWTTLIDREEDPVMREQIMAHIRANDRLLLVGLVAFGVLLCLILAAYGIVITHKVAGPLYKISTYFDRIRDGRMGSGAIYNLRRGDQLQEFFSSFKLMHEALRERTQEEIAVLERAIAALEPVATSAEARAELSALLEMKRRKEESLR